MKFLSHIILSLLLIGKLSAQILVGPYAPPVEQNGCTAIFKDSSVIVGWASNAIIERGWQDISNTSLGKTTAGNDTSATEKSGINGIISLGDGGSATLSFNGKITDGPGADFAIFENSFDGLFLELAFVEVSSDGINFFRFDAISLTDTAVQVGSFGTLDATNLYNLAGKYKAEYGTPFDLSELSGINGLDINSISHVKIIDVVGNKNEPYATYDSQNNPINEPWTTAFPTGGFDLDAIAVIHFLPTNIEKQNNIKIAHSYPNPANDRLNIDLLFNKETTYQLFNLNGQLIKEGSLLHHHNTIVIEEFKKGIYFLKLTTKNSLSTTKIIKQ